MNEDQIKITKHIIDRLEAIVTGPEPFKIRDRVRELIEKMREALPKETV